jgi:hypothetical protein
MATMTSTLSHSETSIFDLVSDWNNEGYAIALVDQEGIVIDPFIDPSDYPDMMLHKNGNGAHVLNGQEQGYMILFHSGQLKENKDAYDFLQ